MMKVTIHQSYFIPWLGYFSKLAFSDAFVVLNNVLFRKRHYFDRTRIVNMHGEIRWLSLPVGQNFKKRCNEVYVSPPDSNYIDKLIKTIELSYAKATNYDQEWPKIKEILSHSLSTYSSLVNINIAIIKGIIEYLNLKPPKIYFSSELAGIENELFDATNRIIDICKKIDSDCLIIGGGMSDKVHDFKKISANGIRVYKQDYLSIHPSYQQCRRKRAGFQKGLTLIDSILNVGKEKTRTFLTDKKYNPVQLDFSE